MLKARSTFHYSENYFLMAAPKVAFASKCSHQSFEIFNFSSGGWMATFVHSLQLYFTQKIEFLLSLKSDFIIFVLHLGLQWILNTKCFCMYSFCFA